MNSVTFSDLTLPRQALIRLFQENSYCRIKNLRVRNGDPVLVPAPDIIRHVKLDADDGPRPEVGLNDFDLPRELRNLMRELDDLRNGVIDSIDVRAGLPRQLTLRSNVEDRSE